MKERICNGRGQNYHPTGKTRQNFKILPGPSGLPTHVTWAMFVVFQMFSECQMFCQN